MKTIFVSYVFEDNASLAIRNWKNQGLSSTIDFISEEKDLRQEGRASIETYLRSRIKIANGIIILVGNDTHNHYWIEWEYNYAQNNQLPYEVFRIPGSTGAVPRLISREPLKLSLANFHKTIALWGW